MKHLIIIIVAIFFTTADTNQLFAQSSKDQIEVQVDGLGCPFCAYGLEKKFKEFKGIKDVEIEMETGVFTFTYPSDKAITIDQIEKKVDDAGYTAVTTMIERSSGEVEKNEQQKTEVTEDSEVIEENIFVAGNCGMCEARIVKSAMGTEGVLSAEWDKETQNLKISFDSAQTDVSTISENIALVGHDTQLTKSDSTVYGALPGCCQYERK